jgi:hypothetical protein
LVGCGNDDDDPPSGGGGNIVCADGEAWIGEGLSSNCHTDENGTTCIPMDIGYIFQQNNDAKILMKNVYTGVWYIAGIGTWSTSGNNLRIDIVTRIGGGNSVSVVTYNVSGDTLTLGESIVLTKRDGIYPVDILEPEP